MSSCSTSHGGTICWSPSRKTSSPGGAGSGVVEALMRHGLTIPVLQLGLPDRFIDQGDPGIQLADSGLTGRRHPGIHPRAARAGGACSIIAATSHSKVPA